MKIVKLTTWLVALDASSRYGDAEIPSDRTRTWTYPICRLETDDGVEGFTSGYGVQGQGQAIARGLHEVYWRMIDGADPLAREAIWQKLRGWNRHLYQFTDAWLGMVDVALWDIAGKISDQPIANLLGRYRDRIPSYATMQVFRPNIEQIFAEAQQVKAQGYWGYKLQLKDGPQLDIPRLRAAREAVGRDFRLMQDPNAGYRFTEALLVGQALDELGYYWYEEPVADRQLALIRRLADALATPIVAAETSSLGELHEHLRQGTLDIARGDVHIKGGITGLCKALAACELFGLNLEIHTTGSPLLNIANLHVACAAANCEFLESHHPMYNFGLVGTPLAIDAGGYLHLPQASGLGVELDWDWIDNHTVEKIETA